MGRWLAPAFWMQLHPPLSVQIGCLFKTSVTNRPHSGLHGMREEAVLSQIVGVRTLDRIRWSRIVSNTLFRGAELALWLASAYLAFCYGLPSETLDMTKEMKS